MFNFFKKNKSKEDLDETSFEIELTASVLAYEIARIDGEISTNELNVLMEEIKNKITLVNKVMDNIRGYL